MASGPARRPHQQVKAICNFTLSLESDYGDGIEDFSPTDLPSAGDREVSQPAESAAASGTREEERREERRAENKREEHKPVENKEKQRDPGQASGPSNLNRRQLPPSHLAVLPLGSWAGMDTWLITDSESATKAVMLLPTTQPRQIIVKLNLPCRGYMDALFPALKEHFIGEIKMLFIHEFQEFVPLDNMMRKLTGARFKITRFRGCVAGCNMAELFGPLLGRSAHLSLAIIEPGQHDMAAVARNKLAKLDVHIRHDSQSIEQARPLPDTEGRGVLLTLHKVTVTGQTWARNIICNLAPKRNKKYCQLRLESCRLKKEDLKKLMKQLNKEGIRSVTSDKKTFMEGFDKSITDGAQNVTLHISGR